MATRNFAYGNDTIGNCQCPAVAAGFQPSDHDKSHGIATMYDNEVRDMGFADRSSRIPEEDAKKAWLSMIEKASEANWVDYEELEAAKTVAKELGWME